MAAHEWADAFKNLHSRQVGIITRHATLTNHMLQKALEYCPPDIKVQIRSTMKASLEAYESAAEDLFADAEALEKTITNSRGSDGE